MDNIYAELAGVRRQGRPALLALVVRTYGSAYRREGAAAVLTADGVAAGAISGGCLESDLLAAAAEILSGAPPRLMDYVTSLDDDDLIWGTGTGCGGTVQVLVAPVPEPVLELVDGALAAGRPAGVATVVGGPRLGARLAVAGPEQAGSLGGPGLDRGAAAELRRSLEQGRRQAVYLVFSPGGDLERVVQPGQPLPAVAPEATVVFSQPLYPPPILLICGANEDAVPLARFAVATGFRVTVTDHRPAYADPARFPGARVVRAEPAGMPSHVELGTETYAVLLSHNFQKDLAYLQVLLDHPVAYVGLLGARERSRRLLDMVREARPHWPAGALERIFTPVGLDIGADGPAEIAVSVLAEVLAVRAGRPGVHLRQSRPIPAAAPGPQS